MPYIPKEDRKMFDKEIVDLAFRIRDAGDFNYIIFRIACILVKRFGKKYVMMSWIKGAITDSRDEFKTRIMDPHERKAQKKNGDVLVSVGENVDMLMEDK